jgi:hypothetical protein
MQRDPLEYIDSPNRLLATVTLSIALPICLCIPRLTFAVVLADVFCFLANPATQSTGDGAIGPSPTASFVDGLGIEIGYPSEFVLGSFQSNALKEDFKRAALLIERDRLGTRNAAAIRRARLNTSECLMNVAKLSGTGRQGLN